jgi:DNA-binding transcriptional regulator YdaS (Cro superfamily)
MHGMDLIRSHRGLSAKLARELKLSTGAIAQWVRVPAERLPDVERITGIDRHILRPDICPEPPGAGDRG